MKIAALQMRAIAGNLDATFAGIAGAAHEAAEKNASTLVAPELVVTGYGAGDIIERPLMETK